MDKDTLERLAAMHDAMWDLAANIRAIKQTLYDAKITDPQSLTKLIGEFHKAADKSPGGRGLDLTRTLLGIL